MFRKFIHPQKGIQSFDCTEKKAREYGWTLYEEPKPEPVPTSVEPKADYGIEKSETIKVEDMTPTPVKKKRKPRTKKK